MLAFTSIFPHLNVDFKCAVVYVKRVLFMASVVIYVYSARCHRRQTQNRRQSQYR